MKLVVFSHKPCWASSDSKTGYATDGGFPLQMKALSELFDATILALPCSSSGDRPGELPLVGHNLSILPLTEIPGSGKARKACFPLWLARNSRALWKAIRVADAVHAPIPGDVGTIGMLLASASRRPLFVRHCGNWLVPRTAAERFWRRFMERRAGGRNVMLATGGASEPPSPINPAVRWIFSTSLTAQELEACQTLREPPPPGRGRLIIVCRQESGKGTDRVIESLPLILRDLPGTTLDVVGSGGEMERYRALAVERGVDDRVTFHGQLDHQQVIERLRQADLFCYPTTASEGFPKVVLEALACGLPVVTTRVSVLPQLIGDGGGALLPDVRPETIARLVLECLSDPNGYRRMSERAVATAGRYSLETWRDTIGEHLRAAWGPTRKADR